VAVEDLVAGLARDTEPTAQDCHLLPVQQSGNELHPFIHLVTLLPGAFCSPRKRPYCVTHVSGMNCHPSLRKGNARQIASVRFDNEPHDARFAAKTDILESQFLTQTNIRCNRDSARCWPGSCFDKVVLT